MGGGFVMRFINSNYKKPNKKIRRHSGWKTADNLIKMPKKWIIDNCLEPVVYWDDWSEYRDGCRGYNDMKKFHNKRRYNFKRHSWKRYDLKIARHLKIRQAKKRGRYILTERFK